MQRLKPHFQEYLRRIYASLGQQTTGIVPINLPPDENLGRTEPQNDNGENGSLGPGGKLKILIHWGELDVDRVDQTISEDQGSTSIAKLCGELIHEFKDSMKQQLTELPVVRYPLSKNPNADFVNAATGRPFGSILVPGTEDLYFCPQSGNDEKVKRLNKLFSRLTLPDGRNFPTDSIEVSIDPA